MIGSGRATQVVAIDQLDLRPTDALHVCLAGANPVTAELALFEMLLLGVLTCGRSSTERSLSHIAVRHIFVEVRARAPNVAQAARLNALLNVLDCLSRPRNHRFAKGPLSRGLDNTARAYLLPQVANSSGNRPGPLETLPYLASFKREHLAFSLDRLRDYGPQLDLGPPGGPPQGATKLQLVCAYIQLAHSLPADSPDGCAALSFAAAPGPEVQAAPLLSEPDCGQLLRQHFVDAFVSESVSDAAPQGAQPSFSALAIFISVLADQLERYHTSPWYQCRVPAGASEPERRAAMAQEELPLRPLRLHILRSLIGALSAAPLSWE